MNEEPESAAGFHVYALLAALPVFWGAIFFLLAGTMSEDLLSQIGLDMNLVLGAAVPLLVVSGLMLERAFAARRGGDPS